MPRFVIDDNNKEEQCISINDKHAEIEDSEDQEDSREYIVQKNIFRITKIFNGINEDLIIIIISSQISGILLILDYLLGFSY